MKKLKYILPALFFLLLQVHVSGAITLPSIFGNHMVLQQNQEVVIWGWADPSEKLTITASWDETKTYEVSALPNTKWMTKIKTPKAGGPYTITINGSNTIVIEDVLIGEVWLGSGQSNMEWSLSAQVEGAETARDSANYPEIRLFQVTKSSAFYPQDHVQGEWVVCTPETVWNFSAVMYFFGKELHNSLNVPLGLIHSSWGGTPVETWIDKKLIEYDKILFENSQLLGEDPAWCTFKTGESYNAMIHPIIPYALKGVLWYQGETNTRNSEYYARSLELLIESWRTAWDNDFSFYIAQIAPFSNYGNDNVNGAIVRDQQRLIVGKVSKTGLMVTSDIGNLEDIHPRNKIDVGKRLSLWALNKDYGFDKITYSGPLYKNYTWDKDHLIIHFDHASGGLVHKNDLDKEFEIVLDDGSVKPVSVTIKGENILIKKAALEMAKEVRFAFRNDSTPELYNQAGLPASCFRFNLKI